MKIVSLKVSGHEILNDFEVSFQDKDGKPYDTIILAGENGSGKSTLLDIIFTKLELNPANQKSQEQYEFELELESKEIEAITEFLNGIGPFSREKLRLVVKKKYSEEGWNQIVMKVKIADREHPVQHAVNISNTLRPYHRSIFSDVAINFNSEDIRQVTTLDLDIISRNHIKSSKNLATEITQLFVDISNSDDGDLAAWVSDNPGVAPPESIVRIRMKRFISAFEYMFPAKKFNKIKNFGNSKSVEFKENQKVIQLSKFSSGEKQIIFRGAFLLKDKGVSDGIWVFLDEPEISLHPRWQLKIMNFYKKLFTNEAGIQTSQIFVATHSPFIIHNNNRYNDKVIVLERDVNAKFNIKDSDAEFYSWTTEERISEAFKIDFSSITKNIVFVEGEHDEKYFNKAKELYMANDLNFEIKWIGRKNNGQAEYTGKSALDTTRNFYQANPQLLIGKLVLYYDNDCKKPEEVVGKLYVKSAPIKLNNEVFKKGIESLLFIPENFNVSMFREEITKTDYMGGETIIHKVNKTKLCEAMVNHNEVKNVLKELGDILNFLNNLLK